MYAKQEETHFLVCLFYSFQQVSNCQQRTAVDKKSVAQVVICVKFSILTKKMQHLKCGEVNMIEINTFFARKEKSHQICMHNEKA